MAECRPLQNVPISAEGDLSSCADSSIYWSSWQSLPRKAPSPRRRRNPTAMATACRTPGRSPSASIRSRRRRPTARPTIPTATAPATAPSSSPAPIRSAASRDDWPRARQTRLHLAAGARQPGHGRRPRPRVALSPTAPSAACRWHRRAHPPHAGGRGPGRQQRRVRRRDRGRRRRRRQSRDDVERRRQPRGVGHRRPRPAVVPRRRRDGRPVQPVLPAAEHQHPDRRGHRALPAAAPRCADRPHLQRARAQPLHDLGERDPRPGRRRRFRVDHVGPRTSPSSARCISMAPAPRSWRVTPRRPSPRRRSTGSSPRAPPAASSTSSSSSPTRRARRRSSRSTTCCPTAR